MTETQVWATDWLPQTAKYIHPIDFDKPAVVRPLLDGVDWGRPLEPDSVPMFASIDGARKQKSRGDFVMIKAGITLITPRFADLLRQFDLGAPEDLGPGHRRVELYPMPLFAEDKRSHIADYFFMHVTTEKAAVLPSESKGMDGRVGPTFVKDGDFVMTKDALDGPDIWRDTAIINCFFVSDRLKRTMEDAKIKPVNFMACTVV